MTHGAEREFASAASLPPIPFGKTVIVLAALFGFALGAFLVPTWQVAAESGQALAGLVDYPLDNPFYVYHARLWTLSNQVSALALWLGVPLRAWCIVVSGALMGLSFAALTAVALAIARDGLWALVCVAIYLFFYEIGAPEGPAYPIFLGGTHHTYGVLGLSAAALCLGLAGAGAWRSAALLLGILPAVHPGWGAWSVGVALLAWAATRGWRTWPRPVYVSFAIGMTITLTSFITQQFMPYHVGELDAERVEAVRAAFVGRWDSHRAAVPLGAGVYATVLAGILTALHTWRDREPARRFALLCIAISAACALAGAALTHVESMPAFVQILMPGRYLNLTILLFPVITLAALGNHLQHRAIQAVLAIVAVYGLTLLILGKVGPYATDHWLAFTLVALAAGFAPWATESRTSGRVHVATLGVLIVLAWMAHPWWHSAARQDLLHGEVAAALLAAAAGEGVLLPPDGGELLQLRTRRPILFNPGALDQISIMPETGPPIADILRDIYGIDIASPPQAIVEARPGALMGTSTELWEARTHDEWRHLAEVFGFTEVLTRRDSALQIPDFVEGAEFTLYRVRP